MMYQAVNERTEEWTEMFLEEKELWEHLEEISDKDDFWDVFVNGRLEYYWSTKG